MPSKHSPIYQFKINLEHVRPAVWRRIQVPAIIRLGRLHDIVQAVMGWSNSHLHRFEINGMEFSDPLFDEWGELGFMDEWAVRLKDLHLREGTKIFYEYDFGDSWGHKIVLEKILPPDPKMRHPVCLDGARACPPEDVGGFPGYGLFLEALRDPKHEEHKSYMEWFGGAFDPAFFDLDEANRKLRKLKNRETLDSSDWAYEPDYIDPAAREIQPVDEAWLKDFGQQFQSVARSLPLPHDMNVFLDYLLANRVIGTQATGNLPVKDGAVICGNFSKPIDFAGQEEKSSLKVQSSAEVWPLQFVHILAACAGWVQGGPGRRWRVTDQGVAFQQLPEGSQVWQLFNTWWTQVNWGIAAGYGPADYPTQYVRPIVLKHLLVLPKDGPLAWELFADQLMEVLAGPSQEGSGVDRRLGFQREMQMVVAEPMKDLGVLILGTQPHPLLGEDFPVLTDMMLTAMGRKMLQRLEIDGAVAA
ncbi:MAG: plasmid pRiA4b ORF-3 family protein [Anaerolineaceae bacterium]|nr:plasmid pRiA4b ORF-3 family protein [Anaerolineaceae bacterium]